MKMVTTGPTEFLLNQVLGMNPLALPVILAGLLGPFVSQDMRYSRVPLLIFLAVLGILLVSGTAKTYYLASAYPFLFAPGGCALERLSSRNEWTESLRVAVPALLLAGLFLVSPLALPLLPVEAYVRYTTALGVAPRAEERNRLGVLPQHFAVQVGWAELAANVAKVYHSLPPEDRAKARVYATNYGEAGAIDVLGRRLGLPPAISGHNTYWIWGPGDCTGELLIVIGGRYEDHKDDFESVEQAGLSDHPYAMPYERRLRIFVCRKLKAPLDAAWGETKQYI
jgi:hypothetical protein